MVLSTPVISYRNSPPLSYGATPRRIMDNAPAEPRTAVVAAALLGYAVLSIAMTLAFKAALQAFPYPASLVACLLYTSPSPRDQRGARMPSSA